MPKCKVCKTKFEPRFFLQKACFDPVCLAEWSRVDREAKADRKHKDKKKAFQLSDIKIRKNAAVMACHAYIRARDINNGCITCDRPLTGKFDAGHFMKGTNSYTKFMEKNIHGQCVNCNQYNGGREREYEHVLIAKYGKLTVLALKRLRTRKIKRTANDYLLIEKHFKQKLKMVE